MGVLQRVKEGFAYMLMGEKAIGGLSALLGAGGTITPPRTDFETLSKEGYEYNAVIYACITELMDSMSEAPMLAEVQNRKGEWEVKEDHPLARLLANPNPEMSVDEFTRANAMYENIAGNMFWEKERSAATRVVGLWPMRPDRVGIISVKSKPGQRVKQRITGYTWRSGADVVQLPFNDVIHFKYPNPRDDLFGLPPLAAAAREGDTDNKATDYVRSFFENAAVPKGLLRVVGLTDEAEQRRVREALIETYTGTGGWHKPLVLSEGSEWIELAESFKDMDFPNLRKITETRLCMVFDVPPIIIGSYAGLDKATYANYGEARQSYTQETVIPMYRRRDTVLNRTLAPEFGANVRIRSDTSKLAALVEDVTEVWSRAKEALAVGGITVNDFRREVGLEEVEGGDVFLRPMTTIEVTPGQAPELPGAKQYKSSKEEHWHKMVDVTATAWEPLFRKAARERFLEEKDELVKILKKEGKASKQAAPYHKFLESGIAYLLVSKDGWRQEFLPLFEGLLGAQMENVLAAYGIAWDIQRPEVQQWIDNYSIKFAASIGNTSEEAIRGIIAQAQAEGWSVTKTRDAIMETWDGFSKTRADMIARTETMRSSNYGTREAWKEAGVERVSWYTHFDGRQCGWCEEMHGKTISVTEGYATLGQELRDAEGKTMTVTYGDVECPPLHVFCRCLELAVIE